MRRLLLLFSLAAFAAIPSFAQCGKMAVNPTTGKLDCTGTGQGLPNITATGSGSVASLAVTITPLNITNINQAIVKCYTSAGADLAITGMSTSGSSPINTVTPTFTSTANPYCVVASNQGAGPTGPAGATGTTGSAGSAGATGATGPTGPAGSNGTNGTNGTNGAAGASSAITISNAGTTGTTVNTLTKLTGAPSTAVIAAISDTGGVIGITTSGAGTAGSATIAVAGSANCVFDGATTAGNYVGISSTTAGNCHDAGASFPTSGQVIGRVLSTNGSGGTYLVDLFTPEIEPGAGGAASVTEAAIANSEWLTSVSGTNAITASTATTYVSYAAGFAVRLVPANTNTGAVTLAINGISGAKAVTKNGTAALTGGELAAGTAYFLVYDGTEFQIAGIYTGGQTCILGNISGGVTTNLATCNPSGPATLVTETITANTTQTFTNPSANTVVMVKQGGATATPYTYTASSVVNAPQASTTMNAITSFGFSYDGTTQKTEWSVSDQGYSQGPVGVTIPSCPTGNSGDKYRLTFDPTALTLIVENSGCVTPGTVGTEIAVPYTLAPGNNVLLTGLGANGKFTTETLSVSAPITLSGAGAFACPTCVTQAYTTIDSNGGAVTQRPTVNYISGSNATITCADNPGSNRTDCTVSATGGGGSGLTSVGINPAANFISSNSPLTANGALNLAFKALGDTSFDPNAAFNYQMATRRTTRVISNGIGGDSTLGESNGIGCFTNNAAGCTGDTTIGASAGVPVMTGFQSGATSGQVAAFCEGVSGNARLHMAGRANGGIIMTGVLSWNVSTSVREFFGLSTAGTLGTASNCGTWVTTQMAADNYAGAAYVGVFASTAGGENGGDSSHWNICASDGTTQACTASSTAFDTAVHVFELYENQANSRWDMYIDGVGPTSVSSHIPASNTILSWALGGTTLANVNLIPAMAGIEITESWK